MPSAESPIQHRPRRIGTTTPANAAAKGRHGTAWSCLEPSGTPEPQLTTEPDPSAGPVVVEVTYTVKPANEAAFLAAMPHLRRSRMRTGAVHWGIFRAGEVPDQMIEIYVVATWDEHLRQHGGRMTGADVELDRQVKALSEVPPQVAHLLPADGIRQ